MRHRWNNTYSFYYQGKNGKSSQAIASVGSPKVRQLGIRENL